MGRIGRAPNSILIYSYIQQDATLHGLFYLETALHVSGSTNTHHQERKQLYLQHLVFVTPLLPSAAFLEELELQVHWTRTFYIYLCKHCWDPKDVRSFLTLIGL
jgi:hypothetical protein